jgi:hypothetical protein
MALRFLSWPSILVGLVAAALVLYLLWPIPHGSIATIAAAAFLIAGIITEVIRRRVKNVKRTSE